MSGLGQSCCFQPSETFPLCRRERTSFVPMVPLKLKSQNHLKRAREPFCLAPDPIADRGANSIRNYSESKNGEGNRPSNTIVMDRLTPAALGKLVWLIRGLHLLMANDVAPVVDFDHGDLVFLIHHRDRHW